MNNSRIYPKVNYSILCLIYLSFCPTSNLELWIKYSLGISPTFYDFSSLQYTLPPNLWSLFASIHTLVMVSKFLGLSRFEVWIFLWAMLVQQASTRDWVAKYFEQTGRVTYLHERRTGDQIWVNQGLSYQRELNWSRIGWPSFELKETELIKGWESERLSSVRTEYQNFGNRDWFDQRMDNQREQS